ncbi:FHA domain-containing protein [Candidatus Saganbacteria bacterium]|nr:FHA domain-containing protein [Candidatus Saganbacteria bacterium]
MGIVRAVRAVRTAVRERYIGFNAEARGGGEVRVRVRNQFLNPQMNANIAATLHIGGQKIYLPVGGSISIGRDRSCEIRINDPQIDLNHAQIIHQQGKSFRILNYSDKPITLLKPNGRPITVPTDKNLEGSLIPEGARLVLHLSGAIPGKNGRYLEIQLETAKEIGEDVRLLLATRPPIEEVTPEVAQARQEQLAIVQTFIAEQGLTVTKRIDPSLIEGTDFAEARTTDELLTIYLERKDKIRRDWRNTFIQTLLGSGVGWGIMGLLFPISTLVCIGGFIGGAAGSLASYRSSNKAAHRKLDDSICHILFQFDVREIARLLAVRNPAERDRFLGLLEKADSLKAQAVRNQLIEAMSAPALPEATPKED